MTNEESIHPRTQRWCVKQAGWVLLSACVLAVVLSVVAVFVAWDGVHDHRLEAQVEKFTPYTHIPQWPPETVETRFSSFHREILKGEILGLSKAQIAKKLARPGIGQERARECLDEWLESAERIDVLPSVTSDRRMRIHQRAEVYWFDYERVLSFLAVEADAAAAKLLASVATRNSDGTISLSETARKKILTSPVTKYMFKEPRFSEYYHWEWSAGTMVLAVIASIALLLVGWVLTYPHIGWKRIAFVISPIMTAFVMASLWDGNERILEMATISTPILAPVMLLLGRDITSWIKRGFRANSNASGS